MNLSTVLPRRRAGLLAGLSLMAVLFLAVGWTAGTVAANNSGHSAPTAPAAVNPLIAGPADLAAGQPGAVTAGGTTTGAAGVSSAIYPFPGYGGSLGTAPEGTILAAGTGTADMKVDGSDKAAALAKATAAALADAKSQAQAAATAMGVTLKDIYSVSTSSNQTFTYPSVDCTLPMVPTNGTTTQGSAPGSDAGSGVNVPASAPVPSAVSSPPAVCVYAKLTPPTPSSSQLVVTVVVAYRFS
jgi:hypothetical protein